MSKKIIIGIILIVVIIALVVITLVLKRRAEPNPPAIPLTPEEVVSQYFSTEQNSGLIQSEKFLLSDLSKVEVFRESYISFRATSWDLIKKQLEFEVKDSEIKENEALVRIELASEEPDFFTFYLPKATNLDIQLEKEGENWKIKSVNSKDLVLEKKLGEKVEIKQGVFLTPLKIGDYKSGVTIIIEDVHYKYKTIYFDIEYDNKSHLEINFSPTRDWRLLSAENSAYYPTEDQKIIKLLPNETKKTSIFFSIPQESIIKDLIFQNLDKKVVFEIPQY